MLSQFAKCGDPFVTRMHLAMRRVLDLEMGIGYRDEASYEQARAQARNPCKEAQKNCPIPSQVGVLDVSKSPPLHGETRIPPEFSRPDKGPFDLDGAPEIDWEA